MDLVGSILRGGVASIRATARFTVGTGMTYALCYELDEIFTEIGKSGNNFISKFILNGYYDFLNSLTLIEELAFLHILILILLMVSITNITIILFGNEIMKYFDLENKYPSLSTFFKIRAKFQKYYLMWNVFYMFFICFIGIILDLLVLS